MPLKIRCLCWKNTDVKRQRGIKFTGPVRSFLQVYRLQFRFSTEDLSEDAKNHYVSCEVKFSNGAEEDIYSLIDMFSAFLVAMGYSSDTLKDAIIELAESYKVD